MDPNRPKDRHTTAHINEDDMNIIGGINLGNGVAQWGDLDNEIHPIFEKLLHPTPSDAINHALRLASKYLEQDFLMPFWHSVIFSERRKEYIPRFDASIRRISMKTSLTKQEIWTTKACIKAAARYIEAMDVDYIPELNRDYESGTVYFGVTKPQQNGMVKVILLKDLDIVGNPKTKWPNDEINMEERLRAIFIMAVVILHELVHVVRLVRQKIKRDVTGAPLECVCEPRNPSPLHDCQSYRRNKYLGKGASPTNQEHLDYLEPYFENENFTELGDAWDIFVFGGTITGITVPEPGRKCYRPRLNLQWTKERECLGGAGWLPEGHVLRTPWVTKPRRWITDYVVPMRFVCKQFQKRFWEVDVKALEFDAFRFQKLLGMRRQNPFWTDGPDYLASDDSSGERSPSLPGKIGSLEWDVNPEDLEGTVARDSWVGPAESSSGVIPTRERESPEEDSDATPTL